MTKKTGSRRGTAEQIASELDQGLKSCRAVLDDYRSKLSSSGGRDQAPQG